MDNNKTFGPWVVKSDGNSYWPCHDGDYDSIMPTLENATLMAAAPDLLKALKTLADRVVDRFGETIKHEPVAVGQYLDAAYAAIRKAQART